MRITLCMAGLIALGGCMTGPDTQGAATFAAAVLRDAAGAPRGTATVTRTGSGLRLTVAATGLTAGPRGFHIHAIGKCEGPAFMSAGGHWNPEMRQHGRDNPMGSHSGDLPNLMIGAEGTGTLTVDLPAGSEAMLDADGAAVIIHAAADDYRTDPTGNSGARVACGVLTAG